MSNNLENISNKSVDEASKIATVKEAEGIIKSSKVKKNIDNKFASIDNRAKEYLEDKDSDFDHYTSRSVSLVSEVKSNLEKYPDYKKWLKYAFDIFNNSTLEEIEEREKIIDNLDENIKIKAQKESILSNQDNELMIYDTVELVAYSRIDHLISNTATEDMSKNDLDLFNDINAGWREFIENDTTIAFEDVIGEKNLIKLNQSDPREYKLIMNCLKQIAVGNKEDYAKERLKLAKYRKEEDIDKIREKIEDSNKKPSSIKEALDKNDLLEGINMAEERHISQTSIKKNTDNGQSIKEINKNNQDQVDSKQLLTLVPKESPKKISWFSKITNNLNKINPFNRESNEKASGFKSIELMLQKPIEEISISKSGKQICYSGAEGELKILSPNGKTKKYIKLEGLGVVENTAFIGEDQLIVSDQKRIQIYNLKNKELSKKIETHLSPNVQMDKINDLTYLPESNKVAIALRNSRVKIFDLENNEEKIIKSHSRSVICVDASKNTDIVVTGGRDGDIFVHSLDSNISEKLGNIGSVVMDVKISEDGKLATACDNKGFFHIFDIDKKEYLSASQITSKPLKSFELTKDHKKALISDIEGGFYIKDLITDETTAYGKNNVSAIKISPENNKVYFGTSTGIEIHNADKYLAQRKK